MALTFNLCTSQCGEGKRKTLEEVKKQEETAEEEDEDYDDDEGTGWRATEGDLRSPRPVSPPFPSATVLTAYSGVVLDLTTALTQWSEDLDGHSALVIPLTHQYTHNGLTTDRLKGQDKALLTLISRALICARSPPRCSTPASFSTVPVALPFLCKFEANLALGGVAGYDDDFIFSSTIQRLRRVEVPHFDSTLLSSSLIEDCDANISEEAAVLHTRAGFRWAEELADEQDETYTGNEAVPVEKRYYRSAIVLLHRHIRWQFIAESLDASDLLARFRLMVASQTTEKQSTEVMDFARAVHSTVQGTQLHVRFLVTLAAFDQPDTAITSASSSSSCSSSCPSSSSSQRKLLVSSVKDMFDLSIIDFDDTTLASWLDRLASVRGIDGSFLAWYRPSGLTSTAAILQPRLSMVRSPNLWPQRGSSSASFLSLPYLLTRRPLLAAPRRLHLPYMMAVS